MGKTSCKKGQYYCNTDKKCKPIPDGYKVREDGFLVSEGSNPRIPRKAGQPAKSKKHSDLYTDEDPKGTIHGLGFKDVATAKASVAKIRKSSRSHAHKIQAAIAMEQRARVMGKTSEAAVYRKFINSMKKKTKQMNEGSLHKWFKGSKSKDGKGGWVNVVTGGTCASDEPGEGTPKCVSSAKRASMSKKERLSAARRKKKADPNQQSKRGAAKPTYVSTDKPKKKMKEEFISLPLQLEVPQNDGEFKLGLMFRESLEQDRGMLFVFETTDRHSFHMKNTFIPLDIAFINEEGVIESIKELDPMSSIPVYPDGDIRYAVEVNRGWFAENGIEVGDIILEDTEETEIDLTEVKDRKGKGSGTKDACYHKVKSRYSVWPSAYASGALVKCRKVGAANWGNKSEEVEMNVDEAMSSYDRNRKAAAKRAAQRNAERKAGKRGGRMENETYRNEMGTRMHHKGYKAEEVNSTVQQAVQALDEVSKKTLGSYVKKASTEIGTSAIKGDYKKMQKRHKGVLDASDKLTKEEVVNEKKMVKVKIKDPSKIKVKVTDIGAGGKEYVRKNEMDEGQSYGLYRGSGKPKGAMKDFLDKKAKKLEAEKKKQKPEYKNNPAFGDPSHHSNAKSRNEEFVSERRGSDVETLKQNRKSAAETIKQIPSKIKEIQDIKYSIL